MKQRIRVIVSVVISFVLVTLLVNSYRHQRETDQRLTEMQKELQGVFTKHSPEPQTPPAPIILDEAVSGPASVRKQHDLDEVLRLGWNLVDKRNADQAAKAVVVFNEGISKVDPDNAELYNGLGRALLVAGKPREAIGAWRKGLTLAPHYSDMQSGIGWAYWALHDPYRAREAWQKALTINPHSIDAWSAMAWLDLALGKNAEAKDGFQELVNYDPGQKSWDMGLSMARAGNNDMGAIAQFFPMPARDAIERPLLVDPATATRMP